MLGNVDVVMLGNVDVVMLGNVAAEYYVQVATLQTASPGLPWSLYIIDSRLPGHYFINKYLVLSLIKQNNRHQSYLHQLPSRLTDVQCVTKPV